MNHTIKLAFALMIMLLVSAACGGFGVLPTPTPVPEEVELSVLISPTDSGYVEYDGAILTDRIAVPVKFGKFVNLVARPLNGDWIFARWERDLSGANANEALLMDESKIVRAVFVSVNGPPWITPPEPPTPAPTPTSSPPQPFPTTPTPGLPTPTPVPPTPIPPSPLPTSIPLEASFTVDVSGGKAPLTVRFIDTSRGSVTSVEWDFGDGTTSSEANPTHQYTLAGSHTVSLTLTGSGGSDVFTLQEPITVESGPLASVVLSPPKINVVVQGSVALSARAVDQFGNEINDARFTWEATGSMVSIDGTGVLTAGDKAGTYENLVKITATDRGKTLETSVDVIINPGPVATASIEPTDVTLDTGATQSFDVTVSDEFGNQVSDALVSWSVPTDLGGAIDSTGVLTAGTRAGTFKGSIKVNVVSGSYRASATADLSVRPGPLATIEVRPSSITVESGSSQQLTAIGLDQHGNEIHGLAYLWEATGGEITQDGLFTPGGHSGVIEIKVSATVKGSSATGTATVEIPPNFPDFYPLSELNLIGGSALIGDVLRLTRSDLQQVGAAWSTTKQLVGEGFDTVFQFQITDLIGNGADGFAFVIQNSGASVLGNDGPGNGYEGIRNSIAVEFDTWLSPEKLDPDDNHIGVHTRGRESNWAAEKASIGVVSPGIDMSDGAVHTVKIKYTPGTMTIFLDDLVTPILKVSVDIEDTLTLDNGKAWVGFTAATGGSTENHDILSWKFSPILPPPSYSFSTDVKSGVAPLDIEFANTSLGQFDSVSWDFGDGTTSAGSSPTHKYTTAGIHTVVMRVLGPGGDVTLVMTDLITVEPGPLTSVVVEPAQVTMDIGAAQTFTFAALDEFGNQVPNVSAVWSAPSGLGTIDPNGVLTIGTTAGDYPGGVTLVVTQEPVIITKTADVSVRPDPLAVIDTQPESVVLEDART